VRIGRTVPPAAAPLRLSDLWHGLFGMMAPRRAIARIEREIGLDFGVAHVFLVSSGTAALRLTLEALKGLSHRREVIIPAYTCFSVPAAVLTAGLRPTLCDIDSSTFDFAPELLERSLNDDTICVVAHHLFGVPSAVEQIRSRCRPRGVFVLEDAAQGMGAESDGRKLGTLGDVGIFSLGRGKNITCGSGGIIVTNSSEIATAIARRYRHVNGPSLREQLKDFASLVLMAVFIRPWLYWIPAALPFLELGRTIFPKEVPVQRLSGIKAGLLRGWRTALARSNRHRSAAASYFSSRVPSRLAHPSSHPYLRFPIFVSNAQQRDAIYRLSQRRGLGLSVAYPTSIDEITEIRRVCNGKRFPSAHKVADSLLTIPTHHWLSDNDKKAIAELCRNLPAA